MAGLQARIRRQRRLRTQASSLQTMVGWGVCAIFAIALVWWILSLYFGPGRLPFGRTGFGYSVVGMITLGVLVVWWYATQDQVSGWRSKRRDTPAEPNTDVINYPPPATSAMLAALMVVAGFILHKLSHPDADGIGLLGAAMTTIGAAFVFVGYGAEKGAGRGSMQLVWLKVLHGLLMLLSLACVELADIAGAGQPGALFVGATLGAGVVLSARLLHEQLYIVAIGSVVFWGCRIWAVLASLS